MKKFNKFFEENSTNKELYFVKADIFGRLQKGYTHAFNEKQARVQFIKDFLKKHHPELSPKGFRDAAYKAYDKSNAKLHKKVEKPAPAPMLQQAELGL